jgi:hypothetical protein
MVTRFRITVSFFVTTACKQGETMCLVSHLSPALLLLCKLLSSIKLCLSLCRFDYICAWWTGTCLQSYDVFYASIKCSYVTKHEFICFLCTLRLFVIFVTDIL